MKTKKAMKPYTCYLCNGTIEKGQQYAKKSITIGYSGSLTLNFKDGVICDPCANPRFYSMLLFDEDLLAYQYEADQRGTRMNANEIGHHRTTVATDTQGVTRVTYWATPVVTIARSHATLESGGWRTRTTKLRMNQASREYGLGFHVRQVNYRWLVDMPHGEVTPYVDGMTIEKTASR